MVAVSLDDIVLEADVKERIRPLFEHAISSGNVSFEHDWEWQAYCDVLYGLQQFGDHLHSQSSKEKDEISKRRITGIDCEYFIGDIYKNGIQVTGINAILSFLYGRVIALLPEKIIRLRKYSPERRMLLQNACREIFIMRQHPTDHIKLKIWEDSIDEMLSKIMDYVTDGDPKMMLGLREIIPTLIAGNPPYTLAILSQRILSLHYLSLSELMELEKVLLPFQTPPQRIADPEGMKLERAISLLERKEYKNSQQTTSRVQEAIECAEIEIPDNQVIKRVGEGRWRRVYKAWNEEDDCSVAIKVRIPIEEVTSPNKENRKDYGLDELANKEGKNARQLTHPNVVRYFGRGTLEDGRPYIIEEFIEGRTLEKRIELFDFDPHDFYNQREILLQVAQALAYLHKEGYVHRDIKPENIIVPDILGTPVKLVDLGILERLQDSDEQTKVHGSFKYCAPELVQEGILTFGADVFSFGLVIYETLTGEHPFVFEPNERENREAISKNICDEKSYGRVMKKIADSPVLTEFDRIVLTRCLAYNPKERFHNAQELLDFREQSRLSYLINTHKST